MVGTVLVFSQVQTEQLLGNISFFSLTGLAICLALGVGPYKPFIGLVELCFLLLTAQHFFLHRKIPKVVLFVLVTPLVFVLSQYLLPEYAFKKYAIQNLLAYVAIVGTFAFLPAPITVQKKMSAYRLLILSAAVTTSLAQVFAVQFFDKMYGLFDNPHFTVFHAIVTLTIACFFFYENRPVERWLACILFAASAYILWFLPSSLGFVSLMSALVAVLFCLANGRKQYYLGILLIACSIPASALFINFARSNDANVNAKVEAGEYFLRDERNIIWADSWEMQLDADQGQWLLGHGLGGFHKNFSKYTQFSDFVDFVFPHNFILEVLYNSGLLGLLVFLVSVGYATVQLFRSYRIASKPVVLLATALFITVFVYTFLTLPLISRYTTYSFGFVIGFAVWVCQSELKHEKTPS